MRLRNLFAPQHVARTLAQRTSPRGSRSLGPPTPRYMGRRPHFYVAYFCVHSLAVASYLVRFSLYTRATSGSSGSSGFGSVSSEQMDGRTLLIVSAGDHLFCRMSMQIPPSFA